MLPGGQVPDVIEIAWLVAGSLGEREDFLDADLLESVYADLVVHGQVGVLVVAAQDGALLDRKDEALAYRNVHLDLFRRGGGERPFVGKVERVAVLMLLAILS